MLKTSKRCSRPPFPPLSLHCPLRFELLNNQTSGICTASCLVTLAMLKENHHRSLPSAPLLPSRCSHLSFQLPNNQTSGIYTATCLVSVSIRSAYHTSLPLPSLPPLRFELPNNQTSGIYTASCLVTKAMLKEKPDDEQAKPVVRPYTPTSAPNAQGYLDLVIKVGLIGCGVIHVSVVIKQAGAHETDHSTLPAPL